jgi:hypothetical protein
MELTLLFPGARYKVLINQGFAFVENATQVSPSSETLIAQRAPLLGDRLVLTLCSRALNTLLMFLLFKNAINS